MRPAQNETNEIVGMVAPMSSSRADDHSPPFVRASGLLHRLKLTIPTDAHTGQPAARLSKGAHLSANPGSSPRRERPGAGAIRQVMPRQPRQALTRGRRGTLDATRGT